MFLRIDGAHGEGGGQLVRTAVALAAITGQAIEIHDIRARRHPPGLAPQHLLAVRAVAALCAASVEGLELRSRAIRFAPRALAGGTHDFDVGTAGSVTLVLQALLPVMLASRAETTVSIRGGTDVRAAPPSAYFAHVLLPNLRRMGMRVAFDVTRRGYYPRGGGAVRARVLPCRVQPLALDSRGPLIAIRGEAHVANLAEHIAARMRDSARAFLFPMSPVDIERKVLLSGEAHGKGGALVLWAEFANTVLGAGRVAELGVPAEALGEAAARELLADMAAGVTTDIHASDQLLVYFALAGGGSLLARDASTHALTGIWLTEQFLPVRFAVSRQGGCVRIAVAKR
ncbi:MAG: RNA 3'-terminal phosphate cyclase [Betaproteobacteria bacterium]|nr:MAG: RNA 3'-terminal phosphate cyclase [Betaproteobacteria bacterium]